MRWSERRTGSSVVKPLIEKNWEDVRAHDGEYRHGLPYPGYDPDVEGHIVSVRHPAPWLLSIKRWVDESDTPDLYLDMLLLDLWVAKYHAYLNAFGPPGSREDVLWIRHRDLLDDPRAAVRSWQGRFGPLVGQPKLVDHHASPTPANPERAWDPSYYTEKRYGDDLGEADREALDKMFNRSFGWARWVLEQTGYEGIAGGL